MLARLDFLVECTCLAGCSLQEHPLLLALFGDTAQLGVRLFQLARGCGNASLELTDALGVAALTRGCALEFDGSRIGTILRILCFAVELISALGDRKSVV